MRLTKEQREGIYKIFSALGRKGGLARARKLSPEERSASSSRAALTRWENYRERQLANAAQAESENVAA